jgi:hypothetical protein
MHKRASKHQGPEDMAEIAFRVYQESIGEIVSESPSTKNPAAVALGRMGGKLGGNARAASLSAERRSEIARQAAAKRWGKSGAND